MLKVPSDNRATWLRTRLDGMLRCGECGALVHDWDSGNGYSSDIPRHVEWHKKLATLEEKIDVLEGKTSELDTRTVGMVRLGGN